MFEEIGCVRRHTLPKEQTCSHKTVEGQLKFGVWLPNHGQQERMRELAANRSPELCYFFGGAEPVEPCHQRGVQARRDDQSRRGNGSRCLSSFAFVPRLKHPHPASSGVAVEVRDAAGSTTTRPNIRRTRQIYVCSGEANRGAYKLSCFRACSLTVCGPQISFNSVVWQLGDLRGDGPN